MNHVKEVSDTELEGRLQEHSVALVDFGAKWCAPCKSLLPILEELNREFGSSAAILKVDVDESPDATSKYGIMSMPTVIVFKNGEPVERLVGLRPSSAYQAVLSRYLEA